MARYTPPRPWEPLSDSEFAALSPFFTHQGAGRPILDLRGRLDAIFRLVTTRDPWRDLPPEMGPWGTAHRQFRRWAHAGIWSRLLRAVAAQRAPAALRRVEHWICRAFRRALRILGLAGIALARRLGMASAVNGPFWMLPDPDLSETLLPRVLELLKPGGGLPSRAAIRLALAVHALIGGRQRIPPCLEPA